MRVKKQKRQRRAVRFYTACHGFREPYKILCDGTFVHHLLENRITPADTALTNTLGASVKLFTTRCVIAELKSLGEAYLDAVDAASNLMIARCDHEKKTSAVSCLTEVIGEKNTEHFFVATQDAGLRKKFQETKVEVLQIPGVPLIYALRNALCLEKPSATQQKFVKTAEEERSRLTEVELKMLKRQRKRLANDNPMTSSSADAGHMLELNDLKTSLNRNEIASKDTTQLKRKRAKGPNPLSCKKKQSKDAAPAKENETSSRGSTTGSRKRKRSRKSKITGEASV